MSAGLSGILTAAPPAPCSAQDSGMPSSRHPPCPAFFLFLPPLLPPSLPPSIRPSLPFCPSHAHGLVTRDAAWPRQHAGSYHTTPLHARHTNARKQQVGGGAERRQKHLLHVTRRGQGFGAGEDLVQQRLRIRAPRHMLPAHRTLVCRASHPQQAASSTPGPTWHQRPRGHELPRRTSSRTSPTAWPRLAARHTLSAHARLPTQAQQAARPKPPPSCAPLSGKEGGRESGA